MVKKRFCSGSPTGHWEYWRFFVDFNHASLQDQLTLGPKTCKRPGCRDRFSPTSNLHQVVLSHYLIECFRNSLVIPCLLLQVRSKSYYCLLRTRDAGTEKLRSTFQHCRIKSCLLPPKESSNLNTQFPGHVRVLNRFRRQAQTDYLKQSQPAKTWHRSGATDSSVMVPALQKISSCSLHSSDLKIERVSFCRAQTHEGSTFLGIKSNFPTKNAHSPFFRMPYETWKKHEEIPGGFREGTEHPSNLHKRRLQRSATFAAWETALGPGWSKHVRVSVLDYVSGKTYETIFFM